MFAVICCSGCKRARIADLTSKSSRCPYCNNSDEHKVMKIYFKSNDLSMTRAALNQFTGFTETAEKKHANPDTDPGSSLAYRYEHCHTLEEKMECLAQGLTKIYGEFTFENLEEIETKHAEKMLKAMLVNGYVHETKYGRYTA